MTRKSFILVFIFLSLLSFGQKKHRAKPKPKVEEKIVPIAAIDVDDPEYNVNRRPVYPGGIGEMFKFINKNIIKPDTILKGGDGKVFLWFNVEVDGSITHIKVIKEIPGCPACNDEAIRLVKSMPKWEPALEHGRAVKTDYNFPVSFHPPLNSK